MKTNDWVLVWSWLGFLFLVGPFLFSARDTLLVAVGFGLLIGLIYFTQRRVIPIIKGKLQ
jgi:hypothetical protein